MALTIPPGVDAAGRRNAIFIPTDTLSVAELTGPTAVDVICYLSKGTFGEGAETERGKDERECDTQVAEVFGTTTVTLNDLEYVWEPQADAASPTNKAYDLLKEGTTGFIIVRYGLPSGDALAADQTVDQYPVTLGRQNRKTPEGGAAEKFKIVQPVVVGLGVKQDQKLVA
jgi:hypothetical protein